MPWQRLVADVANELDDDGHPAYREVIVSVPRQSGKTTWVLAQELERCVFREQMQRVAYTAQTGWDARKKLLEDQVPMIEGSPLAAAVRQVYRGAGSEAVIFRNGSMIQVLASTTSAGHGKTLDLGVIDEAFDDLDDRREQAILPAMITKLDAQLVIVSTMGTDASVYLNRKVDLGRAAVENGLDNGVAYFEWSIPEDADIENPRSWWLGMPALGHTITEESVAHAQRTMTEGDFRRAFGNQRTRSAERVIPEVTWRAACRANVEASAPLTYAIEVSPDRDWTALGVAGGGVVELGDYRPGTSWAVPRLVELSHRTDAPVAVDPRSPAGSFIPALRAEGVQVLEFTAAEVARACGSFYDAIADAIVQVRSHGALDAAVEAVTRQPVGDAWRWGRRGTVDISPLMVITLAHAASSNGEGAFVPLFAFSK